MSLVSLDSLLRSVANGARRLRQFQRVFGAAKGPVLMALGRLQPERRVEVRIGDDLRPFWLRLGRSDVAVFDEVVVRREYDFGLPATATTIVDAGANVGVTAAWYERRYPGCRVLAIEPEKENFSLLAANARSRPAIIPVRAALSSSPGWVVLVNPHAGSWHYQFGPADADPSSAVGRAADSVPAVTLTQLRERHGFDGVDLLKIDIEGAERDLFEGDPDLLERVAAVAIELHDRDRVGCSRAFFGAVSGFPTEVWRGNTVLVTRDLLPQTSEADS
jgi:FkbM family methyltransferase